MKSFIKNIQLLVVLASVLVLGFTSCLDLEEKPESLLVPSNFFTDLERVEAGVSSAFSKYHSSHTTTQSWIAQVGADDFTTHKASNKEEFRQFDSFSASPSNKWMYQYKWQPLWSTILSANAVINGWETAEANEAELRPVVASAHFIRALAYFDLVRLWGDLPLIVDTPNGQETRSSVQSIYDLIYEDLTMAEAGLPESWSDGKGRPSVWAAKALLARVYLTNAGWPLKDASMYERARDKAKEVIDSGEFGLMPNFSDLWIENNDEILESIFVVRMCNSCTNVPGGWAAGGKTNFLKVGFAAAEGEGFEDLLIEIDFFNNFPAGPRKEATFVTEIGGTTWQDLQSARPTLAKYGAGLGSVWNDTNQDIYITRYADVLLIYAEAANKAEGSPSAAAYQAINEVRTRAGLANLSGLSGQEFHNAVLDERAWEFTGEYIHRWFDMTRNEIVEEVSANRNADEISIVGEVTKDDYYAPIPANDIIRNPNLTQNPGY